METHRNTPSECETKVRLLRGELSAIHTYRQISGKLRPESHAFAVHQILRNHEHAAATLGDNLASGDRQEAEQGDTWKTLGLIVETTTDPLVDTMALKALKEGEEQCELAYTNALDSSALDSATRSLIRSELLPGSKTNQRILSGLLLSAVSAT